MNTFHLSKSAKWGTPKPVIEFARAVLGEIDLDPASSAEFNQRVGAKRYFTEEDDGLSQLWIGRVFLNPPGDPTGKLIQLFWEKLVDSYVTMRVESAFWVGFSLEQLVSLQKYPVHPLSPRVWLVIPSRRLAYYDPEAGDDADQPTHGSYLALLPSRVQVQRERQFVQWVGQNFGAAVKPFVVPSTT